MNKKFKVLDLFCGAGGVSQGFSSAGYEISAGIDCDIEALQTYSYNFPEALAINYDLSLAHGNGSILLDKIRKLSIDVLVGGPPCQGFSIAGKKNVKDPRNILFRAYLEIIKNVNPKAIIIENVPNIINFDKGAYREAIIDGLASNGYETYYLKLNSADFGVPQNRKRVFFIALPKGQFKTSLIEKLSSYTSSKIPCKMAISDLPLLDDSLGGNETVYETDCKTDYQKQMRNGSNVLFNHWAVDHKPETKRIIAMVPDGGNYKNLPVHLQSTRKVNIAWTRMNSNKPCFTIDAGHNHHFHYKANRVPTVRECARIQSFPDAFRFFGKKTSQYKQVGNAVPPLVAKSIAEELREVLCDISA